MHRKEGENWCCGFDGGHRGRGTRSPTRGKRANTRAIMWCCNTCAPPSSRGTQPRRERDQMRGAIQWDIESKSSCAAGVPGNCDDTDTRD